MGRLLQHFAQRYTGCQIQEGDDLDNNLGSIFRADLVNADKKIKNGKAPGSDNTPPEIMKAYIGSLKNIMINLQQDGREKEEVPMKWKTDYFAKLSK